MWECGLKLYGRYFRDEGIGVTPYVGVWIETTYTRQLSQVSYVTPYVGVWIETVELEIYFSRNQVTPYVGVWIETWTKMISLG